RWRMTPEQRVVLYSALYLLGMSVIVLSGKCDQRFLSDDAFYYFQIARNAAQGHGFSFDGIHPTNGFHPLLGWLEVPVFAVLRTPWAPIRVVLIFLSLCGALCGYMVFRLVSVTSGARCGEWAAIFFFTSPFVWILPLRGCEGSLSILML